MWSTLIFLFYIFLVFLFIWGCCGLVLDFSITFFLHHQLSPQNFLELMDGSWSDGKRIMNYKEEDEYEEEEEEEETEIGSEEDDKKRRVARNHSKRGFKAGSSVPPCCQVDGCNADLSDAKAYHKRHKVCEYHAKAPAVLIGEQHQRFCQQCSRFHELSEFDDSKRSCRRRLAGHNERRRKNASEYQGL